MAHVLVTGGTGTLGSHVVLNLKANGHDVRVASRRPGIGTHQVDLNTAEGLESAVDGVQWIVHAASETGRMGRRDVDQTRNLLTAAGRTIEHFLYISIVGIDQIPFRYYREKLRCEELMSGSTVPYTIIRATQFHELLNTTLGYIARFPLRPIPKGFKFQPVAAKEVATRIVDLIELPPAGRADDFGGPEVLDISTVAGTWIDHRARPRRFFQVPVPGRVAGAFRSGLNTSPRHADGKETWAEFVSQQPGY